MAKRSKKNTRRDDDNNGELDLEGGARIDQLLAEANRTTNSAPTTKAAPVATEEAQPERTARWNDVTFSLLENGINDATRALRSMIVGEGMGRHHPRDGWRKRVSPFLIKWSSRLQVPPQLLLLPQEERGLGREPFHATVARFVDEAWETEGGGAELAGEVLSDAISANKKGLEYRDNLSHAVVRMVLETEAGQRVEAGSNDEFASGVCQAYLDSNGQDEGYAQYVERVVTGLNLKPMAVVALIGLRPNASEVVKVDESGSEATGEAASA